MKFISNEEVNDILDRIEKKNFKGLEKKIIKGDKVKYNYMLTYIKGKDIETRSKLLDNADKYIDTHKDIDEKLMRILNHILLEVPRVDDMEFLSRESSKLSKMNRDIKKELRSQKDTFKDHESKMEGMQNQFISILGIFAAIILTFFGGISILGSVLNNINAISKYRLIFVVLLIGFVMFNIIYMLLYAISKLTGKFISVKVNSCRECNKSNIYVCVRNRHPILFYNNMFYFIAIIFTVVTYSIEKYNLVELMIKIIKQYFNNMRSIIVLSVILVLSIILIIFIIKKMYKNSVSGCNCNIQNDRNFMSTNTEEIPIGFDIDIQSEEAAYD